MIGKQYEYDAMAKCEKEMWWFKCLHEITLEKIEKLSFKEAKILDAGCGTGGMLDYLHDKGFSNLTGFDLSSDAIEHTRKNSALQVELISILECDKFYPENSFDIIICNDILVLLKDNDDKLAFGKLISLLKPGGLLLMNFAAGKLFRGTHDVACEMVKRYSKDEIEKLADGSESKIKELIYWPFLLSPLIFIVRFYQRCKMMLYKNREFESDVKLPPPIFNNIFYQVTKFENKKIPVKSWGSSIFAVITKNNY